MYSIGGDKDTERPFESNLKLTKIILMDKLEHYANAVCSPFCYYNWLKSAVPIPRVLMA